jgi:hypothetical protein
MTHFADMSFVYIFIFRRLLAIATDILGTRDTLFDRPRLATGKGALEVPILAQDTTLCTATITTIHVLIAN